MGQIWNKMFVQVFVRPTRYTYEFMEKYDTFTLNAFEPKYKQHFPSLAQNRAANGDKNCLAGLTPMASRKSPRPFQRSQSSA